LTGCGSGHEYLAVTPEGDIYPCHQFVGNEKFKMGNVKEGVLNRDIQNYFKNSNVYTKKECDSCWAKFYCSGGCAAIRIIFIKISILCTKSDANWRKKRVECALWIKAQEM